MKLGFIPLLMLFGGAQAALKESDPGRGLRGLASSQRTFDNSPRIRREWRTLSKKERQRVADAMWEMKTKNTTEGQTLYGPRFKNHDEIVLLHACATLDRRCDQGHYSPAFMTFHRAMLLAYENSLLEIDPEIEALPYWDYAKDTYVSLLHNSCAPVSEYIHSNLLFLLPAFLITETLESTFKILKSTSLVTIFLAITKGMQTKTML